MTIVAIFVASSKPECRLPTNGKPNFSNILRIPLLEKNLNGLRKRDR